MLSRRAFSVKNLVQLSMVSQFWSYQQYPPEKMMGCPFQVAAMSEISPVFPFGSRIPGTCLSGTWST